MTTPLAASWGRLSAVMTPSYLSKDGRTRAWSMDPNGEQRGESWMPNTSAWPNDASVCSLSQILETGPIPPKYFLSGKACAGILRRAERRGKELPEALRSALAAVAGATSTRRSTPDAKTDPSGISLPEPSPCASKGGRIDAESETLVVRSIGVDEEQNAAAELMGCLKSRREGGGQEAFCAVAIPLDLRNATRDPEKHDEQNRQGCGVGAVGEPARQEVQATAQTITADMYRSGGATAGNNPGVRNLFPAHMAVRRLTPVECEILMGFPPNYTNIPGYDSNKTGEFGGNKGVADGPRYKALGNSMAVPCMAWIGRRIKEAYAND